MCATSEPEEVLEEAFGFVCEYVWKASLGFYEETEPARQVWVQERLLRPAR